MGLIEKSDHDRINKVLPVCEIAIKLCGNLIDFSYLLFEKSRACLICHSCKVDILLFKIGFDIDLLTILVHCHIFCLFVILASLPMQMLQCPFFLFFFSGTDGTVSCMASYFVCNGIFSGILSRAGNINVRPHESPSTV